MPTTGLVKRTGVTLTDMVLDTDPDADRDVRVPPRWQSRPLTRVPKRSVPVSASSICPTDGFELLQVARVRESRIAGVRKVAASGDPSTGNSRHRIGLQPNGRDRARPCRHGGSTLHSIRARDDIVRPIEVNRGDTRRGTDAVDQKCRHQSRRIGGRALEPPRERLSTDSRAICIFGGRDQLERIEQQK